jgi:hypothetical protein
MSGADTQITWIYWFNSHGDDFYFNNDSKVGAEIDLPFTATAEMAYSYYAPLNVIDDRQG